MDKIDVNTIKAESIFQEIVDFIVEEVKKAVSHPCSVNSCQHPAYESDIQ